MTNYEIGKSFKTVTELEDYLAKIKKELPVEDYKTQRKEVCRGWGANQYGLRLIIASFFIIGKALRRETTTYNEIWSLFGYGSDKTVLHVVKALSKICMENNLPMYTVLVKSGKTKRVGDGFFKNTNLGNDLDEETKASLEKEHEERCFNTERPGEEELLDYIKTYLSQRQK